MKTYRDLAHERIGEVVREAVGYVEFFHCDRFRNVFEGLLDDFDNTIDCDPAFAAAMDQKVEEGPPPEVLKLEWEGRRRRRCR